MVENRGRGCQPTRIPPIADTPVEAAPEEDQVTPPPPPMTTQDPPPIFSLGQSATTNDLRGAIQYFTQVVTSQAKFLTQVATSQVKDSMRCYLQLFTKEISQFVE